MTLTKASSVVPRNNVVNLLFCADFSVFIERPPRRSPNRTQPNSASCSHMASCRETFNPLVVLDFGWSSCYFFQHGAMHDVIMEPVQVGRVWGHLFLSMGTWGHLACSQLCMTLERWKGGCLGWNITMLSFLDAFQQNLVMKCIFYCLTVA